MEQPHSPYTPPPSYGYPPPAPPTNGLAIASLVLSLLGLASSRFWAPCWASSSVIQPATRLSRAGVCRVGKGWRGPASSSAG